MPPVESTRRLLGASFDLLARSSPEMRPASFYVGLVILGTVAPLALAAWATIVTDVQRTAFESMVVLGPTYEAWDTFLVWIAGVGFLVALIDARIIAVSLLGARLVGRPITVRQALARARAVFWQAVVATVIVGGGSFLIQAGIGAVLGSQGDVDGSIGIVVTLHRDRVVRRPVRLSARRASRSATCRRSRRSGARSGSSARGRWPRSWWRCPRPQPSS